MSLRHVRRLILLAVVGLALNAGLGLALTGAGHGVERFCPFGGVETLWTIVTRQTFTCATGPYNLTLLVALLALTLVARKAFCAWICPVGTVAEALGALARRLRRGRGARSALAPGLVEPPAGLDTGLRGLRVLVLVAVVAFTVGTGELVFRAYDPYYVLFSAHGPEVRWWSYPLIGGLLGAGLVVPMAWCRYLCPLGGVPWPFARGGWLRLRRDPGACVACARCDTACPHGLAVADQAQVRSGECTLCLACVDACDTHGALSLAGAGTERRVPAPVIVLLLALATGAGLLTAEAVAFGSYDQAYGAAPADAALRVVTMDVQGVRCVDTARLAARQLEGVPGVIDLRAFAADHRLRVSYDPARVTLAAIREALEGPVYQEGSGAFLFGVYCVREVLDDQPLAPEGAR